MVNVALRAAAVVLLSAGCAGRTSGPSDRVRVLDSMPYGAIILRENSYECPTVSSGIIGEPLWYALGDAGAMGADAIVVVEETTEGNRWCLRVKIIRIPQ